MRRLVLAVASLCLLAVASPATAARCTGRYLVPGPLVPGGPAGVDVIEVENRQVTIASGCPRFRAKVKGKKKFTTVVAKWKNRCQGIPGKATLKARIDASCNTLTGRFVAKKIDLDTQVTATRAVCGNAVVEPGEACDGTACAGGAACGADCLCSESVTGSLVVPANAFADADTNDPGMAGDNDTLETAQALPVPATAGGAAFAASLERRDIDVYRVELDGHPLVISLAIADHEATDLDLHLVDANGVDIVPPSEGVEKFEQITTTTETGTAFVVVFAFFDGSNPPVEPDPWTNYVLGVGQGVPAGTRVPPEADFVPGEMIVRFRDATPLVATGYLQLADTGATLVSGDPLDGGGLFRIESWAAAVRAADPRAETLAAIKTMRKRQDVLWAEPNYVYQALLTPNDEFFGFQWHYPLISLPEAWEITTGSPGVIVAVIDTGELTTHPDMDPARFVPGFDFISDASRARDGDGIDADPFDNGDRTGGGSSSFHGTHVAGTVGAFTNNGMGVAGVDFAAKIMAIRVLGVGGGSNADIAQGIRFAAGLPNDSGTVPAQRADVINMSLGGPGSSLTIRQAVQAARSAGVSVVVAAGNENEDAAGFTPASFPEVVTVSACDLRRAKAPYSNFGDVVDVAAPGGDTSVDRNGDGFADGILSTAGDDAGGGPTDFVFKFFQGTSMASPHMAGVVALMQAAFGATHGGARFTPDDLDAFLASGAITDPLPPADAFWSGNGLINARKAVEVAGGAPSTAPPSLVALPNSVGLGADLSDVSVLLKNGGSGTVTITGVATSPGSEFLSVTPSVALPAPAPVSLAVAVDRTGHAPGTQLTATITVTSDAGDAAIQVTALVVGGGALGGDVGVTYALLVDPDTFDTLAQVETTAATGYPVAFSDVAPGTYILVAGTDRNGDGDISDPGEAFGAFPNTTDFVPLVVPEAGTVTVSIPVAEQVPLAAGAGRGFGRRPPAVFRRLR